MNKQTNIILALINKKISKLLVKIKGMLLEIKNKSSLFNHNKDNINYMIL